eukprot:TRINITY_DN21814_c0_g2_i1.p1 TRINITY_DN21814_c0_g2~~TRINITY_DN21814_c0_g2_i1.p1  ORF type:complete len:325 (+),score=26.80 TRINITY_DN21814_c0_g2_i1:40-1014(+)
MDEHSPLRHSFAPCEESTSWQILVLGGEFEPEDEDAPNCGGYALQSVAAAEVIAPVSSSISSEVLTSLDVQVAGEFYGALTPSRSRILLANRSGGHLQMLDANCLTQVGVVPTPSGWPSQISPQLESSDVVFAIGGQSNGQTSSLCWSWNEGLSLWSPLPALPQGLVHHSVSTWNEGPVITGGVTHGKKPEKSAWFLDFHRAEWVQWPELPQAVSYHNSAFADDGRLWVVGGHGDQKLFSSAWSLDPREKAWRCWGGKLRGPRWTHGLESVPDGLVAVGGYGPYGSRYRLRYLDSIECIDIRSDRVRLEGQLINPRAKVTTVRR